MACPPRPFGRGAGVPTNGFERFPFAQVAMYWAFTTLTTVGYGDVLPVSQAEMAVSIVVQFAGTCILGYVMGDVASMLTKEEASAKMIKERIEGINAYRPASTSVSADFLRRRTAGVALVPTPRLSG